MRKEHFNAIDHIKVLNQLRLKYDKTFTEEEFRKDLKDFNILSNSIFFSELQNSGIIKRIQKEIFSFSDPKKPIHYKKLERVYIRYCERLLRYRETYKKKKFCKEQEETKRIQESINFLKSKGFEIYAPVKSLFCKV